MDIITPRLLKGFRDFSTQDMLKREFVLDKIRDVVRSYGFDELQTPTLEYADILLGNIGNDEKLIYQFVDDGDRHVALKYDHTVSTCRYIAMHYPTLVMPFKRYQIQSSYRAENTQKGRYREFLQVDADIFGVEDIGADIEMILLTCDIYKHLGFSDFTVYISDRVLLQGISYDIISVIDKIDKIGFDGVVEELQKKGIKDAKHIVEGVLHTKPNERIQQILSLARVRGFKDHVIFDPSIMRSFSYSTGTIWEVRVDGYKGSLLGGERFDSLVSRFSKNEVPGIGFGLGFDRTVEAMEQYGLLPVLQTNAQALISVFDKKFFDIYLNYANLFREAGINCEVYPLMDEKIGKQFKYADKKGIRYVITIGEDEIKDNKVSIKDMKTGEQQLLSFENVLQYIQEHL